ncbi:hypothetical protein BACCAP_00494 [Pseudoflavonifractor capillosus ATCC 29799]|uniref:Uncharacterized protein n=1 Tax=Pseudoflavonifractor capillosus ATCC 29799 TaxID=411467 RepID=A6NQM3_9FIRM|nr:hypothetical protein BACCAP_00494 [Pseudoflavonifractor capillosus ATCC 29799]
MADGATILQEIEHHPPCSLLSKKTGGLFRQSEPAGITFSAGCFLQWEAGRGIINYLWNGR